MDLRRCQSECIELFFEMRKKDNYRQAVAAPFLSSADRFLAGPEGRAILLVGKATDGQWKIEDFDPDTKCHYSERVEERCLTARAFVEKMRDEPKSAFWRFWRDLNQIGSPVIWTNLSKIGIQSGNPRGWYLQEQSELAVRTLKAEIAEYRPSLVVLVTSDYAKDETVYQIWPQKLWTISGRDGTCWIVGSGNRTTPVLWTDHPQGKRRERIRYWLEMANWLITNQDSSLSADPSKGTKAFMCRLKGDRQDVF